MSRKMSHKTRNEKFFQKISHGIVLVSYILALVTPNTAHALITKADDSIDVDCKSYCSMYQKVYGTYFNDFKNFNAADSQLCADLGKPTTTNYDTTKTPATAPSSSPSPAPSSIACGAGTLTVTQGIYDMLAASGRNLATMANPTDACTFIGQAQDLCQNYNSSVANYCLAYNAMEGVGGAKSIVAWDSILATIDAGTAVACGVACAMPANPDAYAACMVMGTVEGVHETIATTVQMSSSMNKEINEANSKLEEMAGAGLIGIGGGITSVGAGSASIKAAGNGEKFGKVGEKSAGRYMACASAVFYTTLFAVRTANAILIRRASDEACKSVKSHLSKATPTTTSSTSGSTSSSSTGVSGPGSGGGGGGGSELSGGGVSASSGLSGGDPFGGCSDIASSFAAGASENSGAADVNSLNGADLNDILSQIPDPKSLMKDAFQSGAGAALANVLPASTGEFGASLSKIATAAQTDASKISGAFGIQPSAYSSGGGGSGGGGGSSSATPRGTLGSMMAQGKAAAGAGLASFQKKLNRTVDIWHVDSDTNIFQIITHKLNEVSDRVHGD